MVVCRMSRITFRLPICFAIISSYLPGVVFISPFCRNLSQKNVSVCHVTQSVQRSRDNRRNRTTVINERLIINDTTIVSFGTVVLGDGLVQFVFCFLL